MGPTCDISGRNWRATASMEGMIRFALCDL